MLEIKNLSFNVESNNEELGIINDVSLSFERENLLLSQVQMVEENLQLLSLLWELKKLRVVR